jgi:L-ribulose-5-phosphate 3-epimerase
MKIGASYWMFEGGLEAKLPVFDAMKQAKKLGFDSIELCIASQGVLTDKTTKEECKAIVAEAKRIGIEISSVASGESWGKSPTSNDAKVRKAIIEFTKKALQVTKWLEDISKQIQVR